MKKVREFIINISKLYKLGIINNFGGFVSKKYNKLSRREHKYYISLIKRYRVLGILDSGKIKLSLIEIKTNEYTQ